MAWHGYTKKLYKYPFRFKRSSGLETSTGLTHTPLLCYDTSSIPRTVHLDHGYYRIVRRRLQNYYTAGPKVPPPPPSQAPPSRQADSRVHCDRRAAPVYMPGGRKGRRGHPWASQSTCLNVDTVRRISNQVLQQYRHTNKKEPNKNKRLTFFDRVKKLPLRK